MKYKDCLRNRHDSHDYKGGFGTRSEYTDDMFYSYEFLKKADWDQFVELWKEARYEGINMVFDRDSIGIICDRISKIEQTMRVICSDDVKKLKRSKKK